MSEKNLKQCLIFGGETKTLNNDQIEEQLDEIDNSNQDLAPSERKERPSPYVQVFETMVRTVLECESELLSMEEVEILERFSLLCYAARYCLVRLILRTSNRWYPISSLESYKKEVGEGGLEIGIKELCSLFTGPGPTEDTVKSEPPDDDVAIKQEDSPEIIDLSLHLDDEDVKPDLNTPPPSTTPLTKEVFDELWPKIAGPSQPADPIASLFSSDISTINMEAFCQTESIMTTREILDRMNKDQLVMLTKEMGCKLKPNFKKGDIIDALIRQATSQQVLDFTRPQNRKGKVRADGLRQTQLSFLKMTNSTKPKNNQEQRLRHLAIKRLGPCIRVNIEFYRLVRRLHIIYFRETEYPTDLLLPALLSTFKKRNFTPVKHKRTAQVWVSREELLEYERALELDKILDDIGDEKPESASKRTTKTPALRSGSFATPASPVSVRTSSTFETPVKPQSVQPKSEWGADTFDFEHVELEEESVQQTRELKIKKHFGDWVYPRWQNFVLVEVGGVRPRPIGLERFDAGHVYTRMVHKAIKIIAKLKDYQFELKVLDALLDQRFWCRGKRAKWHTRRAIALGHLATKEKNLLKKRQIQSQMLDGIKEALLDDDTGIVHRPNLVKRLQDIEKKLKIPLEDRSRCSGELREAPFVIIKAARVQPLSFDAQGRPINDTPELHKFLLVTKKVDDTAEEKPMKRTGKSSWHGKDGQVVNVETLALEHYQEQGYKGFHCETRILTMLFGLLFWDIIFAEVTGAFETPYQTAPLDLLYDCFYRAREALIVPRLRQIQAGKAREILEKHDSANRDKAIMCVGVSWELCSREDLLDIVDCIGGHTLSTICQIFCEDYDGRRSGGPDLFVWNVESRKCKFVEVKGPGDTPQENQKLWFDSLLRAKADVEICYVRDVARSGSPKLRRKTSSSSRRRKRVKDHPKSEERNYDKFDTDGDELPASERPKKRPRTEKVEQNESDSRTMSDEKAIRVEVDPTTCKLSAEI